MAASGRLLMVLRRTIMTTFRRLQQSQKGCRTWRRFRICRMWLGVFGIRPVRARRRTARASARTGNCRELVKARLCGRAIKRWCVVL